MTPQIFSTVPNDILIRILALIQDTHPKSLHNLFFIKSTQAVAERLIYQRVTIKAPREGWPKVWPPYRILLKRLSDPQSHLSSLVRELTIVNWPGTGSYEFDTEPLERLVENMKDLVVFRWETLSKIPPTVLSKIQTLFPTAHIQAKNGPSDRSRYGPHHLDIDILCSPQLYSLEFMALQSREHNNHPNKIISELPVLKQILQSSPNLRVLRIGCTQNRGYDYDNFSDHYKSFHPNGEGPLNLQFQNGDHFPTLVEFGILKIPHCIHESCYDLNKSHCISFKRAMNWKALARLDLGNARPHDFFIIFRSHVPQLKSLKFRLSRGKDGNEDPAPLLRATTRFLDSITALEELEIADWTRSFFPHLRESIVKHANSLTYLEVNASERGYSYVPAWDADAVTALLSGLPKLRALKMAIDLLRDPTKGFGGALRWPSDSFGPLFQLANLESLQIRIRLPHTNSVKSRPRQEDTLKLATDIFTDFFRHNADSRLELLDVQVQRSYDSFFEAGIEGVTAIVRRGVRDDALALLEGGYEVEVNDSWDEF